MRSLFIKVLKTSMLWILHRLFWRYRRIRIRGNNKRHRRCWWQRQLLVLAWIHACVRELNQNLFVWHACFEWTTPNMRTNMHVDSSAEMYTMQRGMGLRRVVSGRSVARRQGWVPRAIVTWPQFVCCCDWRKLLRIRLQGNSSRSITHRLARRLDCKIHMFQR